ncbi:MAG: ABC transporter substrate-binding protein [Candidatus Cloacimonetes bacterium]|nr:ABC transporter substrate-binding protein [Candidatus Cloacimonadota bacterium]
MRYKMLIILLFFSMILSCGHRAEHYIVFWHALGGPLGDALDEMIYDFNREHPNIRIRAISMGNYQALSQKLMASIQAGNQPDLAQVFESWTANLVRGGVLLALNEFIEKDEDFMENIDDIFPVFLDSVTIDGQIWSFPFNKSVRVMYYNKDIFFRNDLDYNNPPKTWEDYLELCKLLTQDTSGDGRINQWGTTFATDMWRFQNLLLQAGGDLMNDDFTVPLFNSKEGLEALNFFDRMLNVDRSAYLSTGRDNQNHFLASTVAFIEGSSVSYVFMRDAEIVFNLGIAPVPVFRTERNIISGTNIAIFDKGNPEKETAAWEFIKWFTEPKQTAKFSSLTYYMPIRRSAFEQPYIQAMLKHHPGMIEVYKQLEYAEFEPQIPEWFEFRRNFEEIVLERVFNRTISPEEALRQAEQRLLREL